jgi:hypothetical protein
VVSVRSTTTRLVPIRTVSINSLANSGAVTGSTSPYAETTNTSASHALVATPNPALAALRSSQIQHLHSLFTRNLPTRSSTNTVDMYLRRPSCYGRTVRKASPLRSAAHGSQFACGSRERCVAGV